MTQGLSVARLIAVALSLTQAGASFANFDSALIIGESDVIDTQTRIELFNTLSEVAGLFGTSAPEYLAAEAYFSPSPTPTSLYIGRWAHGATNGRLFGGVLTAGQQAIGNFTSVTTGAFHITVDGGSATLVPGMDFHLQTNLNGVATVINTALATASAGATVVWNGSQFIFKSATTGAASKVVPLTAPGSGTDITALLAGTLATGAREVDGIAAESLLTAVTIIDALPTFWYGLDTDACPDAVYADREAVTAYIEADATPHLYGISTSDTVALGTSAQTDIGAVLQAGGYTRTFCHFSSTSPYVAAEDFGIMLTVDWAGANTTKTLAYKEMPGITPELLTGAQASALDSKGYNYYATFQNGVSIIVNGWMVCSSPIANQIFFDERQGADVLANEIQTNVFNLLVEDPKVAQTDAGGHLMSLAMSAALDAFVTNGYLAPGTWNSAGFGQLAQGDFLPKGYYVYQPPIATQQQADRQARKSVAFQIAGKTAGAIQSADIALTINP